MDIWVVGISNQLFITLKLKLIGPFCNHHSVCPINIGFWQGNFVWKCCSFQSKYFQPKNGFPGFWRFSIFRKIISKLRHWERSKFPRLSLKTMPILKRRAIFQIPSIVFRRTYAFSVGFKMKPLSKSVFLCQDKNQLKFCRKTWWKEQPFILCLFHESRFHVTMECKELNWLRKHFKKVRSSRASISIILVLDWVKTVFPVSIVNSSAPKVAAKKMFWKFQKIPVK